jgi:hypothetical protein
MIAPLQNPEKPNNSVGLEIHASSRFWAFSLQKMCHPTGVVMGLRPTQGDENALGPTTTLQGSVALSFVIGIS